MGIRVNFDEIDNPFLFVVVSAERAEQLQRGALPRVTLKSKKSTTIAMAEAIKKRVRYFTEEELRNKQESEDDKQVDDKSEQAESL